MDQEKQIVSFYQRKSTFLYILDMNKHSFREVNEHDFTNAEGGVINYRSFLIKFVGTTRKAAFTVLPFLIPSTARKPRLRYSPQVLSELRGVRSFFRLITEATTRLQVVQKFISDHSKPLIDSMLDSLLILLEIVEGTLSWSKILRVLLNVARVWFRMEPIISRANMEAQSVEALLMGAATLALPMRVVEALRRVAMFSSVKFLDDASLLFDLISTIGDFFTAVFTGSATFGFVSSFSSFFGIFSHYKTLYNIRSAIKEFEINNRCVLREQYRTRVEALEAEVRASAVVLDWIKRSGKIDALMKKFTWLTKVVKAFESTSRVEPFSLCFEGPPGCLKSVVMSSLIKILNKTVYTHSIKATTDGKDFYDSYNGEEIFCMDDVGQQGVSQYRTLINLISPIKYPLDCASVDLKDTKYFTSSCVMFTTNRFMSLSGLTRADGISDITALWRRVLVFDMSKSRRVKNSLVGSISVKFFDTRQGVWVEGLPEDVSSFMLQRGCNIPFSFTMPENDSKAMLKLYSWMGAIYRLLSDTKTRNDVSNTLSVNEIADAQELSQNYYTSQGGYFSSMDMSDQEFRDRDEELQHIFGLDDADSNEPAGGSEISETRSWRDTMTWLLDLMKETGEWLMQTSINHLTSLFGSVSDKMMTYSSVGFMIGATTASIMWGLTRWVKGHQLDRQVQAQQAVAEAVDFTNTMSSFISTQMFTVKCVEDKTYVTALISGHYIIAPHHWTQKNKFHCIVYRNFDKDHRLIDQLPITRVFSSEADDIAVFQMDEAVVLPFKSMAHFFDVNRDRNGVWLVTSKGPIKLLGTLNSDEVVYNYFGEDHSVAPGAGVEYDYGFNGLCGSVLFSERDGIVGAHVAGSAHKGISRIWSKETRKKIKEICTKEKFLLDEAYSQREEESTSGFKLMVKEFGSTPKKTKLVPSPLYGVFEVMRTPADLVKFGEHTVKDIFKEARSVVADVDHEELTFARSVITTSFDNYGVLSDKEVVLGTSKLAGLAKDTSTGPYMMKDREKYVNFQTGEFTELLYSEINKIALAVETGNVKLKDILNQATLKDELRDNTKLGVPRCFMVLRMVINILLKKYTGRFVESIISLRDFNHIMVGINPYRDYEKIYPTLGTKVICSDIKYYDKNMLPQVQFMVRDVMISKFQGTIKEKEELKFLLTLLICGATMVNDDVFLVTHSMPSGCYLTAIVNSLVNKAYGAMWFYRMTKGNVKEYYDSLIYRTYGDDLAITVKRHSDVLNALTLRDFFRSVGLDLTTSNKQEISTPFDEIPEFLKRTFRYHPLIQKVMCPLSLKTLKSTLSWVWSDKDCYGTLQDKLHMFQREAFLHENYEELVSTVELEAEKRNIPFKRLPTSYLVYLYSNDLVEYESVDGVLRT